MIKSKGLLRYEARFAKRSQEKEEIIKHWLLDEADLLKRLAPKEKREKPTTIEQAKSRLMEVASYCKVIAPELYKEIKDNHYVYIIGEPDSNTNRTVVKIGRSHNPEKRASNIRYNSGNENLKVLYQLCCGDYAEKVENSVHKVLRLRKVGRIGERFRITKDEAVPVIEATFYKLKAEDGLD